MMQGRVYFYAVSAVLMWSTTAALVKSLLTAIPTYEALFVSSLAGCLFLIVMQLVRDGGRVFRAYDVRGYAAMAGLGFLGIFLSRGSTTTGFRSSPRRRRASSTSSGR